MSKKKSRQRAKARTLSKLELESEPSFKNDPDVVEWGGELYRAVDFTSGGAPIGLRLTEIRETEARFSNEAWAQAKRVLNCVFDEHGKVDIGRVVKVGQGLSYQVFAASVDLENDPNALSGNYAVLLPLRTNATTNEGRMETRRRLLQQRAICNHVAAQTSSIHIPDLRAIVPLPEGDAVVRPFIRGVLLDLRTGRQPGVKPWEIVAQVAATIHAIDMRAIVDLRGFPTRRAHGLSELEQLEGFPELSEAYTWALEHLPPDEPSVLIHGDLLGQNILVGAWGEGRQRRPEASNVQPESDNGLAVIDWENAMLGDPAYDLAIVTRGSRTPFRMDRGLECLLEAYANFGVLGEGRQRRPEAPNVQTGQPSIAAHEVHFYELCLLARWYRDAFYGNGSGESAGSLLGQLRNVLARARRASSGKVD